MNDRFSFVFLESKDKKKRRTTDVLNHMLWGNSNDGQRGFIHQVGDVIENVFRPTAKRQEMLLQQIIDKLDRENSNQELKKLKGKVLNILKEIDEFLAYILNNIYCI